ncbi:Lrp/AsnC family transcriptional regulator [Candidatus Woesearchaeota archaeon]|nr:Lrp/AsnC family transcriptional regulator [Candidatus Woesearchaeota archaeon]
MVSLSEREIIFFYTEQARLKMKGLALLMKRSPQRLKYNLKTLETTNLVLKPFSIIDYSYFGLHLFRVYFKGGYISEKDKEKILQKIKEHPYVISIAELTGGYDLVLEMQAPNASRFNKELKSMISQFPNLNNYKIILNIVTHLYPRSYLLKGSRLLKEVSVTSNFENDIVIGGDREYQKLTDTEINIIKNLLYTPRVRLTKLAKATNLNVKTATKILQNLQNRNIIRGFQHLLDINALGFFRQRWFLKLHNISQERENDLMDYFLKTPEIIQVNKTVGDWDMEVEVESLEKTKVRFLIVQLRENFIDLIENFNNIEFYQYHQRTFLPKYLFQDNVKNSTSISN